MSADALKERELAVFKLAAERRTNKGVGDALALAEVTVKKHVQAVLAKLGASGRTHAGVLAMRLGLLK